MAEEKENINQAAVSSPATNTPAGNFEMPDPVISKGEKFYNWVVYSFVNYWVNLTGSVALADKVINGSWRKPFDLAIGKVAKSVQGSGIIKSLEVAHNNSKVALETLALTGGGWLLVIPMKWMEDRKRPIVRWLNKKFGEEQIGADGHALTADEIYIEKEQPHQSWARVLGRRVLASTAVVLSGSALDHGFKDKSKLVKHEYKINPYKADSELVVHEAHLGGKERITNLITNYVHKGLEVGGETLQKGGVIERWIRLLALDSFFTKVSAMVMFLTNGAKKKKMPHEVNSAPAVAAAPALPVDGAVSMSCSMEVQQGHPAPRKYTHTVTSRAEHNKERFTSHVQKLAAEPDQQLQPNM